jgi:hypothetical protein
VAPVDEQEDGEGEAEEEEGASDAGWGLRVGRGGAGERLRVMVDCEEEEGRQSTRRIGRLRHGAEPLFGSVGAGKVVDLRLPSLSSARVPVSNRAEGKKERRWWVRKTERRGETGD